MRLRQTMLLGCGIALGQDRRMMAGSGGRCWRMKRSGMLLAWSGCDHPRPPRGCPSNLLSFESKQREAKVFAEREPEEERRSL